MSSTNADKSNTFFGLGLLLEAAKYHDMKSITTPSCHEKRIDTLLSTPPCPLAPTKLQLLTEVSSSLPPKKRLKMIDGDWTHSTTSSYPNPPPSSIDFKKPTKCSGVQSHRVWERINDCYMTDTATAVRQIQPSTPIHDVKQHQQDEDADVKVPSSDNESFMLYHEDDDIHINAVHNVVRRDIWEGFIVDASQNENSMMTSNANVMGRIARYDGTVGLRCRFCKHVPLDERAPRSAVYPRCLEKIYSANLRFQRDHIE